MTTPPHRKSTYPPSVSRAGICLRETVAFPTALLVTEETGQPRGPSRALAPQTGWPSQEMVNYVVMKKPEAGLMSRWGSSGLQPDPTMQRTKGAAGPLVQGHPGELSVRREPREGLEGSPDTILTLDFLSLNQ